MEMYLSIYFLSIHFPTEWEKANTKGQNKFILHVYVFVYLWTYIKFKSLRFFLYDMVILIHFGQKKAPRNYDTYAHFKLFTFSLVMAMI